MPSILSFCHSVLCFWISFCLGGLFHVGGLSSQVTLCLNKNKLPTPTTSNFWQNLPSFGQISSIMMFLIFNNKSNTTPIFQAWAIRDRHHRLLSSSLHISSIIPSHSPCFSFSLWVGLCWEYECGWREKLQLNHYNKPIPHPSKPKPKRFAICNNNNKKKTIPLPATFFFL